MSSTACSLDAEELVEQLERYRAIGRLGAAVEQEAGRVIVRFDDDPPSALIERTLQVERGCCPLFEIDYDPVTQRLAIGVGDPDHRPSLDAIAQALADPRATGSPTDSAQTEVHTVPGATSCCSPTALETCCEPKNKPECCGQPAVGRSTVAAPSRCGCRT